MDTGKTECTCNISPLHHASRAHAKYCPTRIAYEYRIRHLGAPIYEQEEPAWFDVKYGDEPEFMKWKEGDFCLAKWHGKYRSFRIVTIGPSSASLHSLSKLPGEHITIRTIRRLDELQPLTKPQPEKTMAFYILKALTLLIPLVALVGLAYAILKPSILDDDNDD